MITEQMLSEKNACEVGKEYFLAQGFDKLGNNEAITRIAIPNPQWGEWLVDRFPHTLAELKDGEGNLLRKWEYDGEGNLLWEWKYDSKGNLLWEWKYDSKGNLLWEWRFK